MDNPTIIIPRRAFSHVLQVHLYKSYGVTSGHEESGVHVTDLMVFRSVFWTGTHCNPTVHCEISELKLYAQ